MTSTTFFFLFLLSHVFAFGIGAVLAVRERRADKRERDSLSVEAEDEFVRLSNPPPAIDLDRPSTLPSTPKSLDRFPTAMRREYIAAMHEEIMKIRDASSVK